MASDEDEKYPRYGQFGDPRRAVEDVCEWCGKNEVTWQLSWRFCSHRCHSAVYVEEYRKMRNFLILIPLFLFILVFFNAHFPWPVLILEFFVLALVFGFWIYSVWMVRTGSIMREKSPSS